jgi:PAS domain S-box-containing protein
MPDHPLSGLVPDASLEPRLRALLHELPPAQAAVLEELWRERERLVALAEQHRLVLQASTDAILVTSIGGVVEYANEAAQLLFAHRRSLRDQRLAELVAREEQEQLKAYLERAASGDAVRAECSVARPDGDVRRVNATISPIREHGFVSGLVVSFTDFTDEARARDEVASSNTRFRDLAEASSDAVWTVDRRGLFTSVNPATLALAGRTRSEMLGRSAIPLIAPEDQSAVAGHFRTVLGGGRERYQCHVIRKDGSRRLVQVANSPITSRGVVSGILGVVRDLTDDHTRSVAFERLERTHTRLVDSAEDAIATIRGRPLHVGEPRVGEGQRQVARRAGGDELRRDPAALGARRPLAALCRDARRRAPAQGGALHAPRRRAARRRRARHAAGRGRTRDRRARRRP